MVSDLFPDGSVLVKSDSSERGVELELVPNTTGTVQKPQLSLEEEIFRLKLEWIMAKTEDEKRRLSREIRDRMGLATKKP